MREIMLPVRIGYARCPAPICDLHTFVDLLPDERSCMVCPECSSACSILVTRQLSLFSGIPQPEDWTYQVFKPGTVGKAAAAESTGRMLLRVQPDLQLEAGSDVPQPYPYLYRYRCHVSHTPYHVRLLQSARSDLQDIPCCLDNFELRPGQRHKGETPHHRVELLGRLTATQLPTTGRLLDRGVLYANVS